MQKQVKDCQKAFAKIREVLQQKDISSISCTQIKESWDGYYLSVFVALDGAFLNFILNTDENSDVLHQVVTDHYNMHRLIEALDAELGERQLGTTRVPERLLDLAAMYDRLQQGLHEAEQVLRMD